MLVGNTDLKIRNMYIMVKHFSKSVKNTQFFRKYPDIRSDQIQQYRSGQIQQYRSGQIQLYRHHQIQQYRSDQTYQYRRYQIYWYRSDQIYQYRSDRIQYYRHYQILPGRPDSTITSILPKDRTTSTVLVCQCSSL